MGAGYIEDVSEVDLTTTINFTTVTNSIAALSITGVIVKDSDEIPSSIGLNSAILCPRPDNFITGFSARRDELSGQYLTVRYTLNYQYFHCAIGQSLFADFAPMLDKLALIAKAFSADDTLSGALDNGLPSFGRLGPMMDASGNKYHGCEVSIPITQFLEV